MICDSNGFAAQSCQVSVLLPAAEAVVPVFHVPHVPSKSRVTEVVEADALTQIPHDSLLDRQVSAA